MKIFLPIILTIFAFLAGFFIGQKTKKVIVQPLAEEIIQKIEKPLEKYSFDNLSNSQIDAGKFKIKDILKEEKEYTSYLFEFNFNPNLDAKSSKKVTGQINIPLSENTESSAGIRMVLMLRGFINQEIYKTGDGTRNAASYFAKNGYITVSPDFLGYAGSDKEAENIFESRFQTYVTALSLLKTLESLNSEPKILSAPADIHSLLTTRNSHLFLWGHSNGGQIALTILELSGVKYPTVLWAPVTKPFPYSVLYYTDESVDKGKFLRKELSKFEDNYDADKYSLTNYMEKINAPILIQQGETDEAVPLSWSQSIVVQMKKMDKDITLITYPGTDHNMRPSWNDAVIKSIEFYKSKEGLEPFDNRE